MGSDTTSSIVPASEDLQDYQTKIYVYSGQEIIYEKNVIHLQWILSKVQIRCLVAHFKVALNALAGYCDKKGNIAAVLGVIGAGAGVAIGAKA